MTTGIYKLTFSSGMFYIGKSTDINTRWRQHREKLVKGMGSVKLQIEFNRCKNYKEEVLFTCHGDHLNILETYCINKLDKSKMLNTAFPAPLSDDDYIHLLANPGLLQYSTPMLIKTLVDQAAIIKKLKTGR